MFRFLRATGLSFGLALTTTTAATAAPETLICTMIGGYSWITGTYIFKIDGDTASVVDGLTLSQGKNPVAATVTQEGDSKTILRWKMSVSSGGKPARLDFRAAILRKAGNKVVMTAKPAGYDNSYQDNGACVRK